MEFAALDYLIYISRPFVVGSPVELCLYLTRLSSSTCFRKAPCDSVQGAIQRSQGSVTQQWGIFLGTAMDQLTCGWISPLPRPSVSIGHRCWQADDCLHPCFVSFLRKQDLWVHRSKSLYSLEGLGQGSCPRGDEEQSSKEATTGQTCPGPISSIFTFTLMGICAAQAMMAQPEQLLTRHNSCG